MVLALCRLSLGVVVLDAGSCVWFCVGFVCVCVDFCRVVTVGRRVCLMLMSSAYLKVYGHVSVAGYRVVCCSCVVVLLSFVVVVISGSVNRPVGLVLFHIHFVMCVMPVVLGVCHVVCRGGHGVRVCCGFGMSRVMMFAVRSGCRVMMFAVRSGCRVMVFVEGGGCRVMMFAEWGGCRVCQGVVVIRGSLSRCCSSLDLCGMCRQGVPAVVGGFPILAGVRWARLPVELWLVFRVVACVLG